MTDDVASVGILWAVPIRDAEFTVHADRRLLEPGIEARVLVAFRLLRTRTARCTDLHYRTHSGSML